MDVLKPGSSEALLKIAGNPIKLSDYADPGVRGPAPGLNEHHDKIMKEY